MIDLDDPTAVHTRAQEKGKIPDDRKCKQCPTRSPRPPPGPPDNYDGLHVKRDGSVDGVWFYHGNAHLVRSKRDLWLAHQDCTKWINTLQHHTVAQLHTTDLHARCARTALTHSFTQAPNFHEYNKYQLSCQWFSTFMASSPNPMELSMKALATRSLSAPVVFAPQKGLLGTLLSPQSAPSTLFRLWSDNRTNTEHLDVRHGSWKCPRGSRTLYASMDFYLLSFSAFISIEPVFIPRSSGVLLIFIA